MCSLPSWAQPKPLSKLGNISNDDLSREKIGNRTIYEKIIRVIRFENYFGQKEGGGPFSYFRTDPIVASL